MDKYEYRAKTEQMLKYMSKKSYKQAKEIADMIDWRKVKNISMLCAVSEIYEYNGEYEKGREILFLAFDRSPTSRKIVYRLGILALKLGEVKEARDCYEEFISLAPNDPNRYILYYKILKAQNAPIEEKIEALESFKKREYVEKWAFELAKMYHEAGKSAECLEECDDLILWFNEGTYVYKAMELKKEYKPLTPLQQEKYDLYLAEEKAKQVAVTEVLEKSATEEVATEKTVSEKTVPEESVETQEQENVLEKIILEETVIEDLVTQGIVSEANLSGQNATKVVEVKEEVVGEEVSQEEAAQETTQPEEALGVTNILPDDVRQLMEELESEAANIQAQKIKRVAEKESVSKESGVLEVAQVAVQNEEQHEIAEKDIVSETVAKEVVKEGPSESAAEEVMEKEPVRLNKENAVSVEEGKIEELAGLKLGATQSMEAVAKALKENVGMRFLEEEESEKPKPLKTQDTGFIVQGRYDLEAQSEVGLKAGLTEEQKKLFSYFVPVHGMSEQIVKVLQSDRKYAKTRNGTSKVGNLLIIGRKGSGKTVLAVDVVKAVQKSRKLKQGKVGIVTADSLNKKDVVEVLEKLYGGAIIIEKASHLSRRSIEDMCEIMEGKTGELFVVLEDERKPLDRLLEQYPRFKKKFTSRLELPVFINDELVTFGQTYAKENGYKIDEMGILALYSRIDMMQLDEHVVTVADVKEIIDDAIEKSQKMTLKKFFKKLFGKKKDKSDRIILKEEDFK